MSDNCCNLTLEVEESPRIAMQISGANYYGPYELPTMSADTKGGAKLGSGLEIDADTLSLNLTDNATGESVTAADASYLASLTVDGKPEKDGTPTPDNPVPVQVVGGYNLLNFQAASQYTINNDGTITLNSTGSFNIKFDALPEGKYWLYARIVSGSASGTNLFVIAGITYFKDDLGTSKQFINAIEPSQIWASGNANFEVGTVVEIMLTENQCTAFTPYGCIGLQVGETITPIDLQGNVLASLPDGTKDVLTVDSVGHVVIEKRVSHIASYNGESVGDVYISTTGELTTGAEVYYKASSAATVDCGYIDMPAIPDGSTISITAQVTPTISASWWARGAAAIAEALKAVRARIGAIEAAIAELATS